MTHPANRIIEHRRYWLAMVAAMLALLLSEQPSMAVEGVVTGGKIDPLPIALPAFIGGSGEAAGAWR